MLSSVSERATAIQTRLIFFELEWAALEDEQADAMLSVDGLEFCEHHLRNERRYRDHLLSEPVLVFISTASSKTTQQPQNKGVVVWSVPVPKYLALTLYTGYSSEVCMMSLLIYSQQRLGLWVCYAMVSGGGNEAGLE